VEQCQHGAVCGECLKVNVKTNKTVSKPWVVHTMPSQLQETGTYLVPNHQHTHKQVKTLQMAPTWLYLQPSTKPTMAPIPELAVDWNNAKVAPLMENI